MEEENLGITVGGVKHVIPKDLLLKFPDSFLGEYVRRNKKQCSDLTLERNPVIFSWILDVYRAGELHINGVVCKVIFPSDINNENCIIVKDILFFL